MMIIATVYFPKPIAHSWIVLDFSQLQCMLPLFMVTVKVETLYLETYRECKRQIRNIQKRWRWSEQQFVAFFCCCCISLLSPSLYVHCGLLLVRVETAVERSLILLYLLCNKPPKPPRRFSKWSHIVVNLGRGRGIHSSSRARCSCSRDMLDVEWSGRRWWFEVYQINY